jgi:hypothetical protein
MPSLSPKENYLRALRHEEYEYVPWTLPRKVNTIKRFAPS